MNLAMGASGSAGRIHPILKESEERQPILNNSLARGASEGAGWIHAMLKESEVTRSIVVDTQGINGDAIDIRYSSNRDAIDIQ